MDSNRFRNKKQIVAIFLLIGLWTLWAFRLFQHDPSAGTPHKVHIAFGFHVNLYHSFRGDTDDENGFGQDIRVIRHIIRELDHFNSRSIPVRAVWDFDNLFSLQEILPAHAPDIIRDVQRRVREGRDEVILMSYNNGLMPAMTDREFMVSMRRAMTNAQGSGVRDLFGQVGAVVRPQEMMTTPGHFGRYRSLGIDAVSLYYSATPFDAFRLFSRELSPAEAHNPVQYRDLESGEEIVVLPTYHAGDLVENVSLRHWAERLHRLQEEGKIDRDVLIFINFDADAEFWTGADLPWHIKWLPNTGGIGQLIESVADLDFVTFSDLSDYLATHEPKGSISFSQDTADGSFNGYHSWAEKAASSDYWTRIERSRRLDQVARRAVAVAGSPELPQTIAALLDDALETRLRALSTTHFGLANPLLARQRESAMASLMDRLDTSSDLLQAAIRTHALALIDRMPAMYASVPGWRIDTFLHLEADAAGDRSLQFSIPDDTFGSNRYFIVDAGGRQIPARVENMERPADKGLFTLTLRVSKRHAMPDGIYSLWVRNETAPAIDAEGTLVAGPRALANDFIHIHFDADGYIDEVLQNGVRQLEADSLIPYLIHRGEKFRPKRLNVSVEADGSAGVAAVRLSGQWDGPPGTTRIPGHVDIHLRLVRDVPYLFVDGEVRYPDTYRKMAIQTQKPMLARTIDIGWEMVAPAELRFSAHATRSHPFLIHKRNYLERESAYAVDYYRFSPDNLNVSNINNHITAEYAAVTTNGRGMAIAMNPEVSANFAFCPFRMEHLPGVDSFVIQANPFGTYHGDQLKPPTRGNRQGYEAVLLSAPQLNSAAPTYNGYHQRFGLMIAFFTSDLIPGDVKQDLIAFARRPATIATRPPKAWQPEAPGVTPPDGLVALLHHGGIVFHWEETGAPDTQYRIRCRSSQGAEEKLFSAEAPPFIVPPSALSGMDGVVTATIEAIDKEGHRSGPSPAIHVQFTPETYHAWDIPAVFKARVVWANLSVWLRRHLI